MRLARCGMGIGLAAAVVAGGSCSSGSSVTDAVGGSSVSSTGTAQGGATSSASAAQGGATSSGGAGQGGATSSGAAGQGGAAASSGSSGQGGGNGQSCQTCANQFYVNDVLSCNNTPSCKPWLTCAQTCGQQDPTSACFTACDNQYPNAAAGYAPIYACACTNCSSECVAIDPCNH